MGSIDRSSPFQGFERRRTPRVGVEFWVQEHCEAGFYYHRVTNLSSEGFFIEKKIPFRVGEEVTIQFGGNRVPVSGTGTRYPSEHRSPDRRHHCGLAGRLHTVSQPRRRLQEV